MYLEIESEAGERATLREGQFMLLEDAPTLVVSRDGSWFFMYETQQLMIEHPEYGGIWVTV